MTKPGCGCVEYEIVWKEWIIHTPVGDRQWQKWWNYCPNCATPAVEIKEGE